MLERVKQAYAEHLRKEDGFTEEDLQDILRCKTVDELADYLHYDLYVDPPSALEELYMVMSHLIPEPFIDCRFSIEICARTHCQAYIYELVMRTNPYHVQGWSDDDTRTVFGYIGKPLSDSLNLRDHVEVAKKLEAELSRALTEAYGKDQETYAHISMVYQLNNCLYRFNVEDYGIDNLQAENVTLGDCEPLPHWSLFRVLYAKK